MEKAKKQSIIKEYGRSETDSGSSEVQIAVLTERISEITEHLRSHKQDHSSRRGLLAMVHQRRKLLNYLDKNDHDRYRDMIKRLKLRRYRAELPEGRCEFF